MSEKDLHIEVLARAVMVSHGYVLLCRNVKHGYYYLPGGHVEFAETAASALARELREEAGLDIRVGRCLQVHEQIFRQKGRLRHELNLLFHVEHGAGSTSPAAPSKPPAPIESLEPKIAFDWIKLTELDSVEFHPEACARWLSKLSDPERIGLTWIPAEG